MIQRLKRVGFVTKMKGKNFGGNNYSTLQCAMTDTDHIYRMSVCEW
jgi:hypothetical protein